MTGKIRAPFLSGASLLTIGTAFFLMPSAAHACNADAAVRNGVPVVDIVCAPGDPAVNTFATSHDVDSVSFSDGNGSDKLTMRGGSILVDTDLPTPEGN